MRQQFNCVMQAIVLELQEHACIHLDDLSPRQSIMVSRSFSQTLTQLEDIQQAIACYANMAANKAREQQQYAKTISVFLSKHRFKYPLATTQSLCYELPYPSNDNQLFISLAKQLIKQLFDDHYCYQKAGILLQQLTPAGSPQQLDLLTPSPLTSPRSKQRLQLIDNINQRYGRDTIYSAACAKQAAWQHTPINRSQRYTTAWHELAIAYCK